MSENWKILTKAMKIGIILIIGGLFLILNEYTPELKAQTDSKDAIAIRVMPNPNHYSALRWYTQKGFSGAPQSIVVDGYEAVRDGRTVYVNVGNASFTDLYTNIYLISYNQDAEEATADIFSQILSHWNFNTNIAIAGHCREDSSIICLKDASCPIGDYCDSGKARIVRDTQRLADLYELDLALENYKKSFSTYPKLSAGTYLSGRTLSVWPSWQDNLAKDLNIGIPIDPVNALGDCPGFNADTCWNENDKKFVKVFPDLPNSSLAYSYMTNTAGSQKVLCAVYESGLAIMNANLKSPTCTDICLDFDKDGYGNPASPACTYPQLDCNDTDPGVTVGSPEAPLNCSDGKDNDCDFLIDCNDIDCIMSAACASAGVCNNNSVCESSLGETCASCPADGCCGPPTCPDGFCDTTCNECQNCAVDCNGYAGCCGVGGCNKDIGECSGPTKCIGDCNGTGVCCGDSICDNFLGESVFLCPADCSAAACVDADQDGYIPGSTPAASCGNVCGAGNSNPCTDNNDCNDAFASVHPGAAEVCDGKDNDCNGSTDDCPGCTEETCAYLCNLPWNYNSSRLAPYTCCGNNAGEGNPYQASEKSPIDYCVDLKDNDCDGLSDMLDPDCSAICTNTGENNWFVPAIPAICDHCGDDGDHDGDQPGAWPANTVDKCDKDCGIVSATVQVGDYQAVEALCDGKDNDCDGTIDENCCSDGTAMNNCKAGGAPKYCNNSLSLVDNCALCSCTGSWVCSLAGTFCCDNACNGICSVAGCTVDKDPDCACFGGDGCCPSSCTSATDSDCAPTCVADGCNGVCPAGCTTAADDPDCACTNNDTICCASSCTPATDNDCVNYCVFNTTFPCVFP